MYGDMVQIFKQKGHEVFPVAPALDRASSRISSEDGIEVLRVKTLDVFSKNKFKKGLANVLLSRQYVNAVQKFWKHITPDLIIVATPSVMFDGFISNLKKRTGATVYLLQKDIFPQNAVDLGYMRQGGTIFNFFKKHEVALLKAADVIGCTSPGNKEYLLNHYPFLKESRLKILYNSTKLLPVEHNPNILKKYGLDGKFNIIFGGNMGKPQQLENIVLLAQNISHLEDVQFVIIGQGTEVDHLKLVVLGKKLSNFKFLDNVDRTEYFNLLSQCNIGLISLHKNFTIPNTPMKLNDYLNAGIPVLASIDRVTDLGKILIKNEMGRFAYADEPEALKTAFLQLYNNDNLRERMSVNGKQFCKENLSDERSYENILQHINDFKNTDV